MNETAQLAGFVAAHAIVGVSEGKSLTPPLLVIEKEDGDAQFIEVTGKSSQEAVMKTERVRSLSARPSGENTWTRAGEFPMPRLSGRLQR